MKKIFNSQRSHGHTQRVAQASECLLPLIHSQISISELTRVSLRDLLLLLLKELLYNSQLSGNCPQKSICMSGLHRPPI